MDDAVKRGGAERGGRRLDAACWRESLAPYAKPDLRRSVFDVATSVLAYLALTAVMYAAVDVSVVLVVVLAVPAAGFLVRTFVVFHDCAHGSFLPWRRANCSLVGAQSGLELRRSRAARQLVFEVAETASVLHRQHRPAPRPPPERPHPQLQPPARPRRKPDLPRCAPAELLGRPPRLRTQALRRGPRPDGHFPRCAPRADRRRDQR